MAGLVRTYTLYDCSVQFLNVTRNSGTTYTKDIGIFIVGIIRVFFDDGNKSGYSIICSLVYSIIKRFLIL